MKIHKGKRYLKIATGLCLVALAFIGMNKLNEEENALMFWVLFFTSVSGLYIAAIAGLEKQQGK